MHAAERCVLEGAIEAAWQTRGAKRVAKTLERERSLKEVEHAGSELGRQASICENIMRVSFASHLILDSCSCPTKSEVVSV